MTTTKLPPAETTPARLLALPGGILSDVHHDTVAALLNKLDPTAIVATPPNPNLVRTLVPSSVKPPVLSPFRGMSPRCVEGPNGRVLFVSIPLNVGSFDPDDVELTANSCSDGSPAFADKEIHRVCLSTKISLEVNPYERETSICGVEEYARQLPGEWLSDGSTHCSTALRGGYRATAEVDGELCSVAGIGQTETSLGVGTSGDGATATLVEVYPNGGISCEAVDPENFGLRGINNVGPKRAETLRQEEFTTPRDVADASVTELAELSGLGRSTATSIQGAAEARADEKPVAIGDDSLLSGDPIFIDIETDGLEPSCVWLIGVLDGDPEDGQYMPFSEENPGDTTHLEAFLSWLDANASNRPLVAWNGYGFDFPVLKDQIRQHCPGYLDTFEGTYQHDLLWWARDKNGGNAALPGRSNKLEHVAEALGWTPQTTGIGGGVVARVYSAYRQEWLSAGENETVNEPDWKRLEAYCEDDVRALATIYDALEEAARRKPGTTSHDRDTGTQGALSDFT